MPRPRDATRRRSQWLLARYNELRASCQKRDVTRFALAFVLVVALWRAVGPGAGREPDEERPPTREPREESPPTLWCVDDTINRSYAFGESCQFTGPGRFFLGVFLAKKKSPRSLLTSRTVRARAVVVLSLSLSLSVDHHHDHAARRVRQILLCRSHYSFEAVGSTDEAASSRPLIGLRRCVPSGGGLSSRADAETEVNVGCLLATSSRNETVSTAILPAEHALRGRSRTTLLLVGDSTDRVAVKEWCEWLEGLNGTDVTPWSAPPPGTTYKADVPHPLAHHHGCTTRYGDGLAGSSRKTLGIANFFTFGVVAPEAQDATAVALMRGVAGPTDPLRASERVLRAARPRVVAPALGLDDDEDPTYVVTQSCLWDMNANRETKLSTEYYTTAHVDAYADGLVDLLLSVKAAFPSSRRWLATCKPLNVNDAAPPEIVTTHGSSSSSSKKKKKTTPTVTTRTRRLAAALDSAAARVARDRPDVVDGVLDSTAVLSGFEFYAEDGRHYKGAGARTYINTLINEVTRNDGLSLSICGRDKVGP